MIPLIGDLTNVDSINRYVHTTILVTLADPDYTIIQANDAYFKLIGYSKEEVRDLFKNKGYKTLHPHDDEITAATLVQQAQFNKDRSFNMNCRLINKFCGYKLVNFSGRVVADKDGNDLCYFLLTDISEQDKLLREYEEEKAFNELVVSFMENSFFEYNIQADSIRLSKSLAKKLGIPNVHKDFYKSGKIEYIVSKESLRSIITKIKDKEMISGEQECELVTLAGEKIWFVCKFRKLYNQEQEPIRVIGKLLEVTNHRKEINSLEKKVKYDGLTKLYNAETAKLLMKDILKKAEDKDDKYAFIIVDLDNFKGINDNFGHAYGDNVLKEVATHLEESFGKKDIVGRLGGDEFIILMKDYLSVDDLYMKINSLGKKIEKVYRSDTIAVRLSSSIGVALFPEHGIDLQGLYEYADVALYDVKKNGKNDTNIYKY